MAQATYQLLIDGKWTDVVIQYDPNHPCVMCEKPVVAASVGGTAICPWCDSGTKRPSDEALRKIGPALRALESDNGGNFRI